MRPHQFVFLPAFLAVALAGCHRSTPRDARLTEPGELVAAAKESGLKNLFVNPAAQAPLARLGAPQISVDPGDAAAVRDASTWRRLDRAHRYDGVLLAGPGTEFAPLLTHLATSPDFRLVRIDNWGALFVRGPGAAFVPPDPKTFQKSIPDPTVRSAYLAQMAMMLDAAGFVPAARDFSVAATSASATAPEGFVAAAAIALRHKQYPLALQNAERALKIDSDNLTALEIEVQTLAALNAPDAAWAVAKHLKSLAPPDDLNALFLHARVANAARAYADEQSSLETLVQLAEQKNLPVTDYRIYLGQCYARQGLARPALEQFERLSTATGLTDQQRADVATALQSIRSRAGALSN